METVTLNDGSVYEGNCILTENALLVYLEHKTLAEGFAILGDPEKTCVIRCNQYGQETKYSGYTHLYTLSENMGGMLSAGLRIP